MSAFHEQQIIKCPNCNILQIGTITQEEGQPWPIFCHQCTACGYQITESEWNQVNTAPVLISHLRAYEEQVRTQQARMAELEAQLAEARAGIITWADANAAYVAANRWADGEAWERADEQLEQAERALFAAVGREYDPAPDQTAGLYCDECEQRTTPDNGDKWGHPCALERYDRCESHLTAGPAPELPGDVLKPDQTAGRPDYDSPDHSGEPVMDGVGRVVE